MNSDITKIVNEGKNVTHILSIEIDTSDDNVKNAVIQFIYDFINKKEMRRTCNNNIIGVTWESFDKKNYYTDSVIFNDIGINQHTAVLMNDLSIFSKNHLKDCVFTIRYLLQKPLSKKVLLL